MMMSVSGRSAAITRSQSDSIANTSILHNRHLPQMKLPKFSGAYAEYKNFIGVFNSVIDSDPFISNVEKLNHLVTCLEKEALGTVKSFHVTDANYPNIS